MSVAFDVNPLLYAIDRASPWHEQAAELVASSLNGTRPCYLFWPVLSGFLRLSTHPRVFADPLSLEQALENLGLLLAAPMVRTASEGPDFPHHLADAAREVHARGGAISDCHIVALMRSHGVREIVTHDRDFRRFDGIRIADPFTD